MNEHFKSLFRRIESKWNSKQCRLTGWKISSRRCQQKLDCCPFNRITTTIAIGQGSQTTKSAMRKLVKRKPTAAAVTPRPSCSASSCCFLLPVGQLCYRLLLLLQVCFGVVISIGNCQWGRKVPPDWEVAGKGDPKQLQLTIEIGCYVPKYLAGWRTRPIQLITVFSG